MKDAIIEVITERLGLEGGSRPITKVIFQQVPDPQIVVEVSGHDAFRLSIADARKLGDALTVATGRSFLRKAGVR